jgi:ubiquinone/menaquinone biosynthesis C-methylase UbiE/DNA-binding transcriptional ArsR family regulator
MSRNVVLGVAHLGVQQLRRSRPAHLSSRDAVTALKAAAEPTRLRILALLAAGELNVTDLTRILGQSQPRISRHVKLLSEAGLIERFKEGSWVYFHLAHATAQAASGNANAGANASGSLARLLLDFVDTADPVLVRDRDKADALKLERQTAAQTFFAEHAAKWDEIRSLHVAETDVEAAIAAALSGVKPFDLLVDLGTGTGRMLELLAGRYARGLGIDVNQAMLAFARANLVAAGLSGSMAGGRQGTSSAQVRHGDLYHLMLADGCAGAVVMHQVLHFLSDPQAAVREAARILAPGGRLLIVDFAPHNLDFLRETYAHERLGFPAATVEQWLRDAGLTATKVQNLQPAAGGNAHDGQTLLPQSQLTVSLWLATRPHLPPDVTDLIDTPHSIPHSMETT